MPNVTADNPTADIESTDGLTELVRDCLAKRMPIVDYGCAHGGLGHRPPAEHIRLVQRGGIIEHYQRDMTVRAAAGITIADLQAALRPHNQYVPIDADDDLTLGEVINHNVYGPLRVTYGSVRDLLLGLHYVDGQARDIHVGGRTVKNVAGYDVTRFMVGGLGEYGAVYEATIRTYAIPKNVMQVKLTLSDPQLLDGLCSGWLLSDAAPATMVLSRNGPDWTVLVGYFGTAHGCSTQLHSLESWIAGKTGMSISDTSTTQLEAHLQDIALLRDWRRRATALVKAIVPPASTGQTCKQLAAWQGGQSAPQIEAMPVHGCIFVGGELDVEQAVTLDGYVNRTIEPVNGLRLWHCRPNHTDRIDPFGPSQPDWPILHRLKGPFDPKNIFNPGRFVPISAKDTDQ